jgi:1-acyl-sn-glycerol-3-phosphate acyltransferase
VVFNHVSLYDPPFLGVFWPEALEVMGASDIWHKPGQDILVRLWGAIPVHRGEYDRALFDKALSALGAGRPLVIAPEGGRSHKPGLRTAKPGLAYIVEKSGLEVVPVAIVGTTDDFWHLASRGRRPTLEMHIGRPFRLPALEGKGEALHAARQRNTDQVMNVLAGLLPEAYRGVYAATAIPPQSG